MNENNELQKNESKHDLILRLRRIEGQVKGLQRMVDEGKGCSDILVQVAAVKAAVNKVGIMIFEQHSKECLNKVLQEEEDKETIDNLLDILNKFIK